VQHLYVTGSTSAVVDLDNPDLASFPLFSRARFIDVELGPGDMLYIPGL
jgi:tRNA wybutosine-synthesizing protein 5